MRARPIPPGQLDLCMRESTPEATAQPADVFILVETLKGRTKFISAALLAATLGEGWTDRKVRAVARAAAPVIVSFPGSPGYKLWEACSVDEINHAIEAFESQAKDMTARALLYKNAYHRRFRG